MRKQGKVVRWDTTRGFGFIRSPDTSADVFFHMRDFRGTDAPYEGLAVVFEEIHVGGKGPRAMAVEVATRTSSAAVPGSSAHRAPPRPDQRSHLATSRLQQRSPQRSTAATSPAGPALLLMLAWAALLAWGVWAGRLPVLMLGMALLLNLVTFFVYWSDKYAAQQGQWRTAEKTLHLLSLLGGWPGAWFAQQILRHKSIKESFRRTYWGTVMLHCIALSVWLFWQPMQKTLRDM